MCPGSELTRPTFQQLIQSLFVKLSLRLIWNGHIHTVMKVKGKGSVMAVLGASLFYAPLCWLSTTQHVVNGKDLELLNVMLGRANFEALNVHV